MLVPTSLTGLPLLMGMLTRLREACMAVLHICHMPWHALQVQRTAARRPAQPLPFGLPPEDVRRLRSSVP